MQKFPGFRNPGKNVQQNTDFERVWSTFSDEILVLLKVLTKSDHTRAVFPLREMLDNFRNRRSKYTLLCTVQEVEETSDVLGTNAEPCTINMMQKEEADFESEDECKIPLIVFSPPNHAQVKEVL